MSKSEKTKIIITIACIKLVQVLQYSVSPVLGQIRDHFSGVNVSLVQMLVTAPALIGAIFSIISGRLVTKISKKKLLMFASLSAGIVGFIPFLSDNFCLLFLSRTLCGVSMGLTTTLSVAIVTDFFEGDERVTVMGISSASYGVGMVAITTLSGQLGVFGFQYTYYINVIGFIICIVIAFFLPETGKVEVNVTEKIELKRDVVKISFWGFLECFFIITFITNIAMHLSGPFEGNTRVTGVLTGIYSGSQIVVGLILGLMVRLFRKYVLPIAMLFFVVGAIILILFSSNFSLLILGAVLCGFSQGMFIPQATVDISTAVRSASATMAAACFSCFMFAGQILSPIITNMLSYIVFGKVTTTNVYIIAAAGMTISALLIVFDKIRLKDDWKSREV